MKRIQRPIRRLALLLALVLASQTGVGADATKDRIAVVDFGVQGEVGVPDVGKIVPELLVSEFVGKFDLVKRTGLETLLREKNLQVSDLMNADKAIVYGKLLPVKYLVVGEVMKTGRFWITAQLVEVGTGAIRSPRKISAPTYPELEDKLPVLGQLLSMSDEDYRQWQNDAPERRVVRQTDELLATARANDSKERGREALAVLDRLLKLDPYHAEARRLRAKIAAYYGPATLIVHDQYPTIRAAMDVACPGDTVMVKPGIYREAISFKDGIRLLGTDRGACRIEPVDGARFAISAVACRSGSIEGLTLDGRDAMLSHRYEIGVQWDVKEGGAWVKAVRDTSPAARAGIQPGARITAINARPVRNGAEADFLIGLWGPLGPVTVELKGPDQSLTVSPEKMEVPGGYRPDGIALLDSQIELRDCLVQRVATGILVIGTQSSPTLKGNEFRENKVSGILIRGAGATPTVIGNQCRSNEQHGIAFDYGAGGRAEENTSEGNRCSGILSLGTGTAATIRRNRSRANGLHGIEFCQGAGGVAEGNTSERNTFCGIIVFGPGTSPTLTGNQCQANKFGIAFSNGSGGTAQGNHCDNNTEWGIWYDTGARPTIAPDNTASGNAKGQIKP